MSGILKRRLPMEFCLRFLRDLCGFRGVHVGVSRRFGQHARRNRNVSLEFLCQLGRAADGIDAGTGFEHDFKIRGWAWRLLRAENLHQISLLLQCFCQTVRVSRMIAENTRFEHRHEGLLLKKFYGQGADEANLYTGEHKWRKDFRRERPVVGCLT